MIKSAIPAGSEKLQYARRGQTHVPAHTVSQRSPLDSRLLFRPWEELDGKLGHLGQSHPHDRSLGVASQLESVDEPGGEGDDVFQGTGEGDSRDVLHGRDLESFRVEDGRPEFTLLLRLGAYCGLAELLSPSGGVIRLVTLSRHLPDLRLGTHLVGDILSDVGSTERRTRRPDLFLDQRRKRRNVGTVDLDTLDGRDRDGTWGDDAVGLELFQDGRQAARGTSRSLVSTYTTYAGSHAETHN